jgi:peptide methionine sulfoxide reductase msrA/msrB
MNTELNMRPKKLKLLALVGVLIIIIMVVVTIVSSHRSVSDAAVIGDGITTDTGGVANLFDFVASTTGHLFGEGGADASWQGEKEVVSDTSEDSGKRATIVLAGGCFWCSEAFLQETPGVVDAVSGYAGGPADTASYKKVSSGTTQHREAVLVTYDPERITLEEVLDVYWAHIDPTDAGGQFADRGFQYTTAIFYQTDAEKEVAEAAKNALGKSGLFDKPIATSIVPYTSFYPAEEYHQDYYKKSSSHYERYKKASGRSGFIEENWAKQAALDFLESEQAQAELPAAIVYVPRVFSQAEIEAGLKKISSEAYEVVVNEDTEAPFKNAYHDNKAQGIYVDVVTGRPLFSSAHKYDSGTGWPSFYQPLEGANLVTKTDTLLGHSRVEVRSEAGHLGHVFDDGPVEHGGKRYCINSLALRFIAKDSMEREGYTAYLDRI